MEINPHQGKQTQSLLLTCSIDWSVKLWNIATFSSSYTTTGSSTGATGGVTGGITGSAAPVVKPLYEFTSSNYDYISDVHWCPIHPGIFATITSGGHVSIWNLCKSLSEPVESVNILANSTTTNAATDDVKKEGTSTQHLPRSTSSSLPSTTPSVALNKFTWSANGRLLLVGDSSGCIHTIQLQDSLFSYTSSDESKLEVILSSSSSSLHIGAYTTTTSTSSTAGAAQVTSGVDDVSISGIVQAPGLSTSVTDKADVFDA